MCWCLRGSGPAEGRNHRPTDPQVLLPLLLRILCYIFGIFLLQLVPQINVMYKLARRKRVRLTYETDVKEIKKRDDSAHVHEKHEYSCQLAEIQSEQTGNKVNGVNPQGSSGSKHTGLVHRWSDGKLMSQQISDLTDLQAKPSNVGLHQPTTVQQQLQV